MYQISTTEFSWRWLFFKHISTKSIYMYATGSVHFEVVSGTQLPTASMINLL
jgi:hypothetical protein